MSRAEKRRLEREELKGKTAKGWARHASPKELGQGTGWFGEFDRVYRQGTDYVVMVRNVDTPWGMVQHACMRNTDNSDIPWAEKQRIKNELFGHDQVAVELFPKTDELVDGANMYHFWVLPSGFDLPFGLHI